ncbi:hypothetical protein V8B97DRAFT_2021033 [Scleroderma yunnanense]
MDFAIVTTIMRAIFPPSIDGGFLKLLHLKAVQVKGCIFHDGPTIIRVTSSFLYHSCFTNFKNTFETVDEPDYVVKLLDDAAVGVVQLKEWLAWEAESQPVKAGVTFKDKTSYHNVCTTRDVFLCDQLKCLKR